MVAAAMASTLQGTLIATSEAATGSSGRYHHGMAHSQDDHAEHSHVVTHMHSDGTVHAHAVDDDDGALDEHIKEHGCACCYSMAIAVGVLPSLNTCSVAEIVFTKLVGEMTSPLRETDPNGLKRPPRPPSIA
jgi:hypothetical protein